jgi:hypothetical protein
MYAMDEILRKIRIQVARFAILMRYRRIKIAKSATYLSPGAECEPTCLPIPVVGFSLSSEKGPDICESGVGGPATGEKNVVCHVGEF